MTPTASRNWGVPVALGLLLGGLCLAGFDTWTWSRRSQPIRYRVSSSSTPYCPEEIRAIDVRIAAKRQVLRMLRGGRLDLLEAAACFRAINESRSGTALMGNARSHSAGSEDERLCREVISWVERHPDHNNDTDSSSSSRDLLCELEERLRTGTLLVPARTLASVQTRALVD